MKTLLTFTSVLAIAHCLVIPKEIDEDAKFEVIKRQAEEYFKNAPKAIQEDSKLLVPELIRKYGYPCEVHTVKSKKGYVLELHRIPYGRKGPSENRPAVYLQHGILSSSADWLLAGTEKGFAYILADAGYDVWMPNVRGTRYSRNHIDLHPDKHAKQFWDFSWHEIGVNDLPDMIDYVIENTKQEKIFYIGHSQGTCVFFVMCSERPEYNDKFRATYHLAPIAYMRWMTSPLLRVIALAEGGLSFLLRMIGVHEFLPQNSFFAKLGEAFCSDDSIFQILCTNSLFAVCGFNPAQMNATLLPVIMGHTPAGASTKQLLHFAQSINSGKFRKYDFGLFGNMGEYGRITPPSYKLKNVKAPTYLFYSRNDWLSNEKDVNKLYKELAGKKGKFLSPDNKFNHVDYLYGIDVPDLIYYRVLGLMKKN